MTTLSFFPITWMGMAAEFVASGARACATGERVNQWAALGFLRQLEQTWVSPAKATRVLVRRLPCDPDVWRA